VTFEAKDIHGKKIRKLKLKYFDRDDFMFSPVGQDGVSDDKNVKEDVDLPVKRFLEDPRNALPDGTLLKDHILYIVVCHGLPFACEGIFGIERGATSWAPNHGDLGSLEQRLQTLYYGWGREIVPPVVSMYMTGGPDAREGVRNHRITTALRYQLAGKRWNVYMHPDTYSFLRHKKDARFVHIPPLSDVRKSLPPYVFGFGVSRIDGQGPREAKRLIDYALYASKYLRPEMTTAYRTPEAKERSGIDLKERLNQAEKENRWGAEEIALLGLGIGPKPNREGIPFLKVPDDGKGGKDFRYLPGGMDRTVVSHNGWNLGRDAPIWKYVDLGVTVSACGGPAYGGGPHITNATFWDNRILMRYLFRGRDLGECFLLSTCYVNWATSLVGDPLYHPDLARTVPDVSPPRLSDKADIKVSLAPAMGKYVGVVTAPVVSNQENPELALLEVRYGKTGSSSEQTSSSRIFSVRPYVVLRDLEPKTEYHLSAVLTDPYGNEINLSQVSKFETGSLKDHKLEFREAVKRNNQWEFSFPRMEGINEKGTIEVQFRAGQSGLLPAIVSKAFSVHFKRYGNRGQINASFKLGGPPRHWSFRSPLKENEKATLICRWRRFPLTRELLLRARDGTEFTLAADVRTPWERMDLRGSVKLVERAGVQVLSARMVNDAEVASESAMALEISPINEEAWSKAQGVWRVEGHFRTKDLGLRTKCLGLRAED